MKNIAIICLVLGLVALGAGLYCQFQVVPAEQGLERLSRGMNIDDPKFRATRTLFMEKNDEKNMLGQIALVSGGLGLLGGVFVGLKKVKLGFIAAAVSSPGLILGLLQATHIFS